MRPFPAAVLAGFCAALVVGTILLLVLLAAPPSPPSAKTPTAPIVREQEPELITPAVACAWFEAEYHEDDPVGLCHDGAPR